MTAATQLARRAAPGLSLASPAIPVGVAAATGELRRRIVIALRDDGLEPLGVRLGAPEVVVAACEAPERRGALGSVLERFPSARLVVVSPHATRHTVQRVVEAGAAGLVLDDAIETSLALTVRAAYAGQLAVPLELSVGLRKPILSSREKQILGMVVMGFTNAEIAGKLFLAESTIKSHLSSVFSKLGVRSRKEAAAVVLDPDTGLGTGILAISDDTPDAAARMNGSLG